MPKYMTVFSGVPLGIEDAIKGIDAMYHTKIQLTISAVVVCDNPQAVRALELLYGVKVEKAETPEGGGNGNGANTAE